MVLVFVPQGDSEMMTDEVEIIPVPPGPGPARSLELLGLGPELGPTGLAKGMLCSSK